MVRKQSQSPYVVGTSIQSKEPRSYRDYFGRLLKRLDIPHLVFHGLRHTFATRCIESQCDYKTVSVILGHSNVATTLNLYVHPNLNQKKRCIDRMSNFLGITWVSLGLYIHGGQKNVLHVCDAHDWRHYHKFFKHTVVLPSTLMFCLDSADVTFFCRDLYESK